MSAYDPHPALLHPSGDVLRSCRALSKIASFAVIAISSVGWLSGAINGVWLHYVLCPDWLVMQPNTAIAMGCSGLALWLWHGRFRVQQQDIAYRLTCGSSILAGGVTALGCLTLMQYGLEINLGTTPLPSPTPVMVTAANGQMAPNTALNFALSGMALLLLLRFQRRSVQFLSSLTFLIALLAFTGHLYRIVPFYQPGSFTGMSISTTIGFTVLAIGTLLACADGGWMQDWNTTAPGGISIRRLVPVGILLPLVLGWLALRIYETVALPPQLVIALRSILEILAFLLILGWHARSLNRIDQHRQVVQQQLLHYERRFHLIFDQSCQFIALLQPDGTLVEVNQTALDFGGLRATEVTGKPLWKTQWWTLSPQTQAQLQQAIATAAQGKLVRYEAEQQGAGATVATIDFSLKPIFDEAGKVIWLLAEGHDITEHKQLEASLCRLYATWEQQTHQRTLQLQDLNRELETFSYSVSHDLRAPLRAIQGYVIVLLQDYRDRLDDVGREYLQRLQTTAHHLDTLIQDLLKYSRLGWTEIQLQRVNLATVVESALLDLDAEIQAYQATITVEPSLPIVIAQRGILQQVVTNLVSNAIKFVSPDVLPQVQIWAEVQDNTVRLWVEDNGIGIAPHHQERIFKTFERLHGIELYPGTGIGLAIVERGVKRLRGQMGVESVLDQGSRFWIQLPRAELPSKVD